MLENLEPEEKPVPPPAHTHISDIVEDVVIERPLTDLEKEEIAEEMAQANVRLQIEEEALKTIKREFKDRMEPDKGIVAEGSRKLRTDIVEEEVKGYGIIDRRTLTVNFFDSSGEFLTARPLRDDERQTKLM